MTLTLSGFKIPLLLALLTTGLCQECQKLHGAPSERSSPRGTGGSRWAKRKANTFWALRLRQDFAPPGRHFVFLFRNAITSWLGILADRYSRFRRSPRIGRMTAFRWPR
jgi:hypothetical protein